MLVDYLEYTNSLEFDSAPDYDRCRKIFRDALLAEKHPLDGKLDFTAPKQKLKQKVRFQLVADVHDQRSFKFPGNSNIIPYQKTISNTKVV